MNDKPKANQDGDLAETKRIMERLVRTPPKPHKEKPFRKKDESANAPAAKRRPDNG